MKNGKMMKKMKMKKKNKKKKPKKKKKAKKTKKKKRPKASIKNSGRTTEKTLSLVSSKTQVKDKDLLNS